MIFENGADDTDLNWHVCHRRQGLAVVIVVKGSPSYVILKYHLFFGYQKIRQNTNNKENKYVDKILNLCVWVRSVHVDDDSGIVGVEMDQRVQDLIDPRSLVEQMDGVRTVHRL